MSEIPKHIEDKMDVLIERFDTKRMHKIMKMLDWSWYTVGVPSEEEIKKSAKERLTNSYKSYLNDDTDSDYFFSESGGIRAIYYPCKTAYEQYPDGNFELMFVAVGLDDY